MTFELLRADLVWQLLRIVDLTDQYLNAVSSSKYLECQESGLLSIAPYPSGAQLLQIPNSRPYVQSDP